MNHMRKYIAALLIITVAAGAVSCGAPGRAGGSRAPHEMTARSLMDDIEPNDVTGIRTDERFIENMMNLSFDLFRGSMEDMEDKANILISPMSVILALAMTANGAVSETLAQMQALLGGGIPLDELNEYLYSYTAKIENTDKVKLHIANSIWFKESLHVNQGFLQTNADFYDAAAYSSAFDARTEQDINNWVSDNTDGMIERILGDDEIGDYCMILLNAVAFDAEWQSVYFTENVRRGVFTDVNAAEADADFMHSNERRYLDDGMATGFIKPYAGRYSFAALLPNEGVSIESYIESLTGTGFLETLCNAEYANVSAYIPKFEYEFEIVMNDLLKELGIPDAFDNERADFSGITETRIWIEKVFHKTFISVNELGTQAGAASMVAMASSRPPDDIIVIRLDRPFVYAIIDDATNLPVFIGAVLTM